ncbi:DUF2147 domain-containing protein [Sphingobium sp. H39-3-25]|uniref:DUF2147 domain-containing protein n=1 Tax=Sphingobium arseniciresistens TaxID=3030834 RepID=UPI0023B8B300|nr:DUF2147 domain-containing protein [Sphingobium arseniciresistens]
MAWVRRMIRLAGMVSLGIMGCAASAGTAAAAHVGESAFIGTWINPRGTVAVETRACGAALCGRVSWAAAQAQQDAADAGVRALVGTEILQDFRPAASGRWEGTVFVPDMGRSFQSIIAMQDAGRMRVSGCILGRWICKSQVWRRL